MLGWAMRMLSTAVLACIYSYDVPYPYPMVISYHDRRHTNRTEGSRAYNADSEEVSVGVNF